MKCHESVVSKYRLQCIRWVGWSALTKYITRYVRKHYDVVRLRKEVAEKLREFARSKSLTISDAVSHLLTKDVEARVLDSLLDLKTFTSRASGVTLKRKLRFEALKPSREVLESIVAETLKALGFSTRTNSKLPAKGGDVEVDVWATKSVGAAQFRVYVSCKNWDRDVDRQVVDQELGRVLQLHQLPHLRILVVRSITEPARRAAFDNGFFVVELREKASAGNAQEMYGIVLRKLREIFIGIAPDSVGSVVES